MDLTSGYNFAPVLNKELQATPTRNKLLAKGAPIWAVGRDTYLTDPSRAGDTLVVIWIVGNQKRFPKAGSPRDCLRKGL